MTTTLIMVSAESVPGDVGGCIANVFKEQGRAYVQAIGPHAVNQAIKAIIIARGYLIMDGIDTVFTPSFHNIATDGREFTAIRFELFDRQPRG